jgi:hypothetical protein
MIDEGSIAMLHDGSPLSAKIVIKQLLLNRDMRRVPKTRHQHSSNLTNTGSAPEFDPKEEKDKVPPTTYNSYLIDVGRVAIYIFLAMCILAIFAALDRPGQTS